MSTAPRPRHRLRNPADRSLMLLLTIPVFFFFSSAATARLLQDDFRKVSLKNTDIAALGINAGQLDEKPCALACVVRGATCRGFHVSSSGTCLVIEKAGEKWPLKTGAAPLSVWLRSSQLRASCSPDKFPISHGASRYRYEAAKKNWALAVGRCEALGSQLVELTSNTERALVSADLRKIPAVEEHVRVGLKQTAGSSEPAGGWKWYVSKIPMTGGWSDGEPNNNGVGKEDSGEMRVSTGKFNDWQSSYVGASVCECFVVK